MAQDIRELLKGAKVVKEAMPKGHQDRFLRKLESALPQRPTKRFKWFNLAASVIILFGLGIGAYQFFQPSKVKSNTIVETKPNVTKTLGDVSPGLKKVEDYYLASINLELSKLKPTLETRDLFDSYVVELEKLNKEYKYLSQELTESGPSELTVNALIDNLKLRLNLLYRLRAQLEELNINKTENDLKSQSV